MDDEENVSFEERPAFLFRESGTTLQRVKSRLMQGTALAVVMIEGQAPPTFRIYEFEPKKWDYDLVCERAVSDTELGAHIRRFEYVTQLGSPHLVTTLIDEALDSGFSAFLIPEPVDVAQGMLGLFTLITTIADNT